MLPRAVAGRGERPEPDGEDDDEHDAEPEEGHRLPRHRDAGAERVDERVPLEGGENAQRQRDQQGHDEAGQGQIDRRRHTLEDQTEGRRVGVPGLAEVTLDGLARELPVLHQERLVEPEQLPVTLELLLAGVLGQEEEDGVAEHVQDDEGEDRDADDDDDQLEELTGDVASHDGRGDGEGPGRTSRDVGFSEREAPPGPNAAISCAASRGTCGRSRPAAPGTRRGSRCPRRRGDPT